MGVCFNRSYPEQEASKIGYFWLIYSPTEVYNMCTSLNSVVLSPVGTVLRMNWMANS